MRNLSRRVRALEEDAGPPGFVYTIMVPDRHPDPDSAPAEACRQAGIPLPSDGDFVLVITEYGDDAQLSAGRREGW